MPPESELEARLVELARCHGLAEPERQVDLGDDDGWIGRVDFLFRGAHGSSSRSTEPTAHDGLVDQRRRRPGHGLRPGRRGHPAVRVRDEAARCGRVDGAAGLLEQQQDAVTVPVGPDNVLRPSARNGEQPTMFQPGTHRGEFTVAFKTGNSVSWTVGGLSVSATMNTKRCPDPTELPAEGNGTGPAIVLLGAGRGRGDRPAPGPSPGAGPRTPHRAEPGRCVGSWPSGRTPTTSSSAAARPCWPTPRPGTP